MADQSRSIEPTANLLLNAMGQVARESLLAKSRRTPIEVGRVLFRPGDAITYVPFPLIGTLSLLAQPDEAIVRSHGWHRSGSPLPLPAHGIGGSPPGS